MFYYNPNRLAVVRENKMVVSMNVKDSRKNELEEPEYVDEVFSEDEELDPWEQDGSRAPGVEEDETEEKAGSGNSPRIPVEPPHRTAGRKPVPSASRPAHPSRMKPPAFGVRARPASNRHRSNGADPVESEAGPIAGLEEESPAPRERYAVPQVTPLPEPERTDRPAEPVPGERFKLQEPPAASLASSRPPAAARTRSAVIPDSATLEALIDKYAPLPSGSLVLGADEAGSPLVFSLDDPSLGALLFMGDDAEANRKHLHAVLTSAALLSTPDILQIDVITPEQESFETDRSSFRQVCAPDDDCVFGLLGDVLTSMEMRLKEERMLPFQLLVLDEVDLLVESLAEESLRFLRWIMRRGPQVGIWPIASIATTALETFDLKTFRAFGFHLYGKMEHTSTSARYASVPAYLLNRLAPGSQGYMKLEQDVIAFSIPAVS